MSTELTKKEENQQLVFKELGAKITAVLSADINNIENSLVVANAIGFMQEALTPEIMAPIMNLQGSKLGFKTDRDLIKNQSTGKYEKGPGYPLEVVKNCFIEMSLIGLLPTGNMWNIIGGNSYVTKEGGTHLLKKPKDFKQAISFIDVKQSDDKMTANVKALIKWTINGESNEEEVNFPVKSDKFTTFDALIGKADRKAKMWLYNKISGLNIADGDADEIPTFESLQKKSPQEVSQNKQYDRIVDHINAATTTNLVELLKCLPAIREVDHDLIQAYSRKHIELSTSIDELNSLKFTSLINEEYDFDLFILLADKKKELTPKAK